MEFPVRCFCDTLLSTKYDAVCGVLKENGEEEILSYQKSGKEFDLPFPSEIDIVQEISFEEYEARCQSIIHTGEVSWSNTSDMQPEVVSSAFQHML